MKSASTLVMEEEKPLLAEISVTEVEQFSAPEAAEISAAAWKTIILLLVGEVLFLAGVGAYVFSGLHRFQNCL